jgi:hypothetical protein
VGVPPARELDVWQLPAGKNVNTEAEDIVEICHQATIEENAAYWEDLVVTLVNCEVCELAIALVTCSYDL